MPILSHKIELKLNKTQVLFMRSCAGAARFAYNWSLSKWNTNYKADQKPSAYSIKKEFNAVKAAEYAWTANIPAAVFSNATLDLGEAFNAFFRKQNDKPTFKSRRKAKLTFNPWDGGKLTVYEKTLRIPLLGFVKMREQLRFSGRIVSGVISETAGKWFVAITVDTSVTKPRLGSGSLGVDLGCKSLAVTSDNETIEGPKPLKKLLASLQRRSRQLSRKVKGGLNRAKAKLGLARLYFRIANVRKDALHNITTRLVLQNTQIAIEDLNVAGMARNHNLARAVSDQAFGEFRRQIEYKAKLYGSQVRVVDRWFPSSKTCSNCGVKKESLSLSDRTFSCGICGFVTDRDYNASLNLKNQIPVLDRELTTTESSPLGSR